MSRLFDQHDVVLCETETVAVGRRPGPAAGNLPHESGLIHWVWISLDQKWIKRAEYACFSVLALFWLREQNRAFFHKGPHTVTYDVDLIRALIWFEIKQVSCGGIKIQQVYNIWNKKQILHTYAYFLISGRYSSNPFPLKVPVTEQYIPHLLFF